MGDVKRISEKVTNILVCNSCGSDTTVYDSREIEGVRRRYRRCIECGKRVTTYEVSEEDFKRLSECFEDKPDVFELAIQSIREIQAITGGLNR